MEYTFIAIIPKLIPKWQYHSCPIYNTQNIRFRKNITHDIRQQSIVLTSWVNFCYEQPNYFSKGVNSACLSEKIITTG